MSHSFSFIIIVILLSATFRTKGNYSTIRIVQTVDTEIIAITCKDGISYAERIRLIHSLPSNLAPEQLERCRAFLESPLAGQPLPDLEFNGLKNELVFALLRQRDGLTELAELLRQCVLQRSTDQHRHCGIVDRRAYIDDLLIEEIAD